MLKWILRRMSRSKQKSIVLFLLGELVNSKDSSIDNATAETIISLAIKSNGNKVTSFIIKD
jgi:hypothetical protein